MNIEEIAQIVSDIEFSDWKFKVILNPPGAFAYLQVSFVTEEVKEDGYGKDIEYHPQQGRKWMLSQHMTKSEVVQTAFKALLTALEHEAREEFRYRGQAVYSPHVNVDKLHELAERKALDMRG